MNMNMNMKSKEVGQDFGRITLIRRLGLRSKIKGRLVSNSFHNRHLLRKFWDSIGNRRGMAMFSGEPSLTFRR
jgi:hypothetical protein